MFWIWQQSFKIQSDRRSATGLVHTSQYQSKTSSVQSFHQLSWVRPGFATTSTNFRQLSLSVRSFPCRQKEASFCCRPPLLPPVWVSFGTSPLSDQFVSDISSDTEWVLKPCITAHFLPEVVTWAPCFISRRLDWPNLDFKSKCKIVYLSFFFM